MIYVTHDQAEAMTMGDRICVMKDGVIQQIDTPMNIYDNPANVFVAGFIGTPPMNLIRGGLLEQEEHFAFRAGAITIPLPEEWSEALEEYAEKPVIFGIRPEDIGSEQAEKSGSPARLHAKVEVREPMGAETFLYLDAGTGTSCIARVDAHRQVAVGDELDLPLFVRRAHLFDAESEKRII